jgi:murein L,D-transpeptidase YafK
MLCSKLFKQDFGAPHSHGARQMHFAKPKIAVQALALASQQAPRTIRSTWLDNFFRLITVVASSILLLIITSLLPEFTAHAAPAIRVASASPSHQSVDQHSNQRPSVGSASGPEQLLIEVYKALSANHLEFAQKKADLLVEAYPSFRLGQLIRGDLLLMHTQPVRQFGEGSGASADALSNLRQEAMVRLKSLRERPDPKLMPRSILQLREDQRSVLVVDAKRSRLYVYQNDNGRPKLITDYYISQGRLGVNKLREGDQKTPVGVYYITSRLEGARLPDFYGPGALPINYPNDWDRVNGRSGSGIWLHGVPPDNYSRPPLSSDGCVVLTNQDLKKLFNSIEIGKTPVVISEHVEFVTRDEWEKERHIANQTLESWLADAESASPARIGANYSPRFKSEKGESLLAWLGKHQEFLTDGASMVFKLRDVTSFLYPGDEEMIVITFTQEQFRRGTGVRLHPVRKRQYWAHEGSRWKIVSESIL